MRIGWVSGDLVSEHFALTDYKRIGLSAVGSAMG